MTIENNYPNLKQLCTLLDQVHVVSEKAYVEIMADQHLVERSIVLLERLSSDEPNVEAARLKLIGELNGRLPVGDFLAASDEEFQKIKGVAQ